MKRLIAIVLVIALTISACASPAGTSGGQGKEISSASEETAGTSGESPSVSEEAQTAEDLAEAEWTGVDRPDREEGFVPAGEAEEEPAAGKVPVTEEEPVTEKEPAAEGLSSGTAVPAAQAGKSGIDYDRPPLSVFAAYIRPHRGAFILDMTLSVLAAAVDLIFPYATRGAINRLLPDKLYTAFFTVMAILLAAYLLRAWFQYLITIVGHRMGTLVEADMRRDGARPCPLPPETAEVQ